MKKNTRTIAVPLMWAAIVFWLHVGRIPSPDNSSWLPPHADKLVHFGMFLILGFCHARAWLYIKHSSMKFLYLFITITSLLYGATLEWLQSMITYRGADIFDWIADGLGSLMGTWIASTGILRSFWTD